MIRFNFVIKNHLRFQLNAVREKMIFDWTNPSAMHHIAYLWRKGVSALVFYELHEMWRCFLYL